MPDTMKCLSVQEPWTWAIVAGIKQIENRSRPTRHRGLLLIHAGKSRGRLGDEGDSLPGLPPYDELAYGAIIGVVELYDCVRVEEVAGQPFAEGPWCWLLRDAKPIEPIPYRGEQCMFNVPLAVLEPCPR